MRKFIESISSYASTFKIGKRVGLRMLAIVLFGAVVIAAQLAPAANASAADCHSKTTKGSFGFRGIQFIPYTQIKWESNPCGNLLRERTICIKGGIPYHHYISKPSGIIVKVGLKARSYCRQNIYNGMSTDGVLKGQYQWRRPGPGREWSAWKTFLNCSGTNCFH